jgi:hypothetical protein
MTESEKAFLTLFIVKNVDVIVFVDTDQLALHGMM